MGKLIQCDRCKCAYITDRKFTKIIVSEFHKEEEKKFDICYECVEAFESFLENKAAHVNYRTYKLQEEEPV